MCVLSELLTEVRKLVNGHGGRYRRHTAVTEERKGSNRIGNVK